MKKSLLKQLKVKLPVQYFQEGEYVIAYSYVLDLATQADNFEEARTRFVEAVEILFEELERKGTTEQVLLDLGWDKISDGNFSPPVEIAKEKVPVLVTMSI